MHTSTPPTRSRSLRHRLLPVAAALVAVVGVGGRHAPAALAAPATAVPWPAAPVSTCSLDACVVSLPSAYSGDADGDGVLDVDELALGTEPGLATSHPSVAVLLDAVRSDALPSFAAARSFVVVLPTQLPSGAALGGKAAPAARAGVLAALGIDPHGVDLAFGVTVSRAALAAGPFGPMQHTVLGLSVGTSTPDGCATSCSARSPGSGTGTGTSTGRANQEHITTYTQPDGIQVLKSRDDDGTVRDVLYTLATESGNTKTFETRHESYDEKGKPTSVSTIRATVEVTQIDRPEPGTTRTIEVRTTDTHTVRTDGRTTDEHVVQKVDTTKDTATGATTTTTTTTITVRTRTADGQTSETSGGSQKTEKCDASGKTCTTTGGYSTGEDAATTPIGSTEADRARFLGRLGWNARYAPVELPSLGEAFSPAKVHSLLILTAPGLDDAVDGASAGVLQLPLSFFTTVNPACAYDADVCSPPGDPGSVPPPLNPGTPGGLG